MRYPDPSLAWPLPYEAVKLIAEKEGCRLEAYLCEAGVPSLAWGATEGITLGMKCTEDWADRRFCKDLWTFTTSVLKLLARKPTTNQLGALVCFAYNVGLEAFKESSVLRYHNAGVPDAAAKAFALWNKVTDPKTKVKRVSNGLTARRAAEAALYLA